MTQAQPDYTLLTAQISKGDEHALEKLFLSLKDSVFSVALGYVRNTEDAEEILQDVFVEVFHSIQTFKGDSSLKTWITRIAINKSLDYIKFKKRKKRFAFVTSIFSKETGEVRIQGSDFNHPGVVMENKEKSQYLFEAIDKLPEKQRDAFMLLKIEQMSQREAAEVLQVTEKALEGLMQRAKENLRKLLSNIYEEL
ncbi:MAG: RNA polymerase sigma factor [Bacteroidetes bacterium]|nr:RNA polymerase sigma factor [Bacteroidota bacterium]